MIPNGIPQSVQLSKDVICSSYYAWLLFVKNVLSGVMCSMHTPSLRAFLPRLALAHDATKIRAFNKQQKKQNKKKAALAAFFIA